MKVKNLQELSKHVWDQIGKHANEIKEVSVGDSIRTDSTVIKADIKMLLYESIMRIIQRHGAIRNVDNDPNYVNRLAANLEEIKISFENGSLRVDTIRDPETTKEFGDNIRGNYSNRD